MGVAIGAAVAPRSATGRISRQLCSVTARGAIDFAAGTLGGDRGLGGREGPGGGHRSFHVLAQVQRRNALSAADHHGGCGRLPVAKRLAPSREGEPRPVPARQEPRPPDRTNGRAASNQNEPRPTAGRMIVSGRVVDARGAPVAGAVVMAYAQLKQAGKPKEFASWSSTVNGQARSDASGQFQIDAARTSSARHDLAGVVAFAPGHGIGVFELDPDAQPAAIEIKLEPEQPIRGRFFDLQGRPVAGVPIKLDGIVLDPREMPLATPLRFGTTGESELPAWPKPATSDADGRFTLHGLGRRLWVKLVVDDPRFASQMLTLGTEGAVAPPRSAPPSAMIRLMGNPDATPLTIALQPARTLTGRVTYADTNIPVANALIHTNAGAIAPESRTDAQGRYRSKLGVFNELSVTAYPPDGEPYLLSFKSFNWPKGAVEQSLDLALPRGVMIRGRVTEAGSGEPIAGAVLRFQPYETLNQSPNTSAPAATNDDGSFQLAIEHCAGLSRHSGAQRRFRAPGNRRSDGSRRQARRRSVLCPRVFSFSMRNRAACRGTSTSR